MKFISKAASLRLDTFKRMLALSAMVFGIFLFAAGCGKDGKIYGYLEHDGVVTFLSVGGFPSYVYY